MSRLVDADKLVWSIPPEEYISRCIVANAPTVEAIPIEWMLKWDDAPLTDESMKIGSSVKTKEIGRTVNWNTVKWMILEWRKENEQID